METNDYIIHRYTKLDFQIYKRLGHKTFHNFYYVRLKNSEESKTYITSLEE